ncbi:MAG: class I SAM-dependent methyltransferase [Phenylobacterium sp.]
MPTLLHVGSGRLTKAQTTPGFDTPDWDEIRLDIDPSVEPDVVGDITDMAQVADASVDAVFSSHNLEHLYPHEAPKALAEMRRVLKPDGFAIVTCPDLQSVAALVAEGKLLDTAYVSGLGPIAPVDMMYGLRTALADGNLYMAHRNGFTLKTLVDALLGARFASVRGMRRRGAFELWACASKRPLDEPDLERLAAEHFPGLRPG